MLFKNNGKTGIKFLNPEIEKRAKIIKTYVAFASFRIWNQDYR